MTEPEIARDCGGRLAIRCVVKAVAGGGGKGMRTVDDPTALWAAIRTARSEARSAFGDSAVYLERRIAPSPAHRDPAARRSRTARSSRSSSASARSSGATRRSSKSRRRSRCRRDLRRRMAAAAAAVARAVELHERRHDRVPARRERRVLLPRDEHAAAGRASGHRDGDEHRPRAVADPDRARRDGSTSIPSARSRRRACDRVPHLCRGSGPGLHAVARPDSRPAARRGPRRARRRRRQRRIHGAGVLRLDDREADRVGAVAGRCDRPDGAGAARVPGARDPHDDPVLPVADAPARLRRRPLTTRPTWTGCSRSEHDSVDGQARASFNEISPREEEVVAIGAALDAYLRASAAQAGGAHRAAARAGSRPRGARRCAGDFEIELQRPDAPCIGRAVAAGPVTASSSTAPRTMSTPRASASSASRCCSTSGDRGCSSRELRSPPPACPASCSSASMDGRSRSASTAVVPGAALPTPRYHARRRAVDRRADAGPRGPRPGRRG